MFFKGLLQYNISPPKIPLFYLILQILMFIQLYKLVEKNQKEVIESPQIILKLRFWACTNKQSLLQWIQVECLTVSVVAFAVMAD